MWVALFFALLTMAWVPSAVVAAAAVTAWLSADEDLDGSRLVAVPALAAIAAFVRFIAGTAALGTSRLGEDVDGIGLVFLAALAGGLAGSAVAALRDRDDS